MNDKAKSYRNTALIAISSVVNIVFSVIKNKILTIILGPSGLGIFAVLADFITFTGSMSLLGISNSGVQAISQASTESKAKVRQTYNTLIKIFSIISLIVVFGINLFTYQISFILVHNESLVWFIRIASLAILFRMRSQLQGILITGMQRITLMAKANIYNGFIVAVISVILVLILHEKSIPFLVITIPLVSWSISFIQSRKVLKELPNITSTILTSEIKPILLLGIATIWAGLLEGGVGMITKTQIIHKFGEEFLGYYQVAIGFTYQYIGFITTSITSDYYPRLVATVSKGSDEVSKFVNQQISISINLIMPLLLIMLTFSKLFITVMFSKKFLPSDSLISYSVAGTLLLVVCWPIAYVFLAHRATKTYLKTEFIGNSTHLILILTAIYLNNFSFLGIAYVLHYIVYLIVITYFFYKNFNGTISKQNIKLFTTNALIVVAIIISKKFVSDIFTYFLGSILVLIFFYLSRKEYYFMYQSIVKKR